MQIVFYPVHYGILTILTFNAKTGVDFYSFIHAFIQLHTNQIIPADLSI